MKKLKIIVLAIVLLTSILLLLSISVPTSSFIYCADCIKCTDVGCVGGDLLCAQYECEGVLIICFTSPPQN